MNATPQTLQQAGTSDAADAIATTMRQLGEAARAATQALAEASTETKNAALTAAAAALRDSREALLQANRIDMDQARERGLTAALLDRLELNDARIEAMACGIEDIVALADPIGSVIAEWSRPNVTADAGALCLKSGNAVILRGGGESSHSSAAIHACLAAGLRVAGLPEAAIQIVPTRDRAAVGYMLSQMKGLVDVIVPRGGRSLVERVQAEARVPVIGHLEGNCHVYVDGAADVDMAREVVLNAKMRRTGICGAAETVLFDAGALTKAQPVLTALLEAGCEVRGDAAVQALDARVKPASEEDWSTEYLAPIIAARVVDGVDGAIAHIAHYSSAHTDAIVTGDQSVAERFLSAVDSAIVLHNASTQFADGGEFGMGAEIGISTDKFHARGPVGVEQLTSYKYVVRGSGQARA